MEKIRLATPDEIKAIEDRIGSPLRRDVWAFPSKNNPSDFAVVRNCIELDPVIFAPSTDDRRKYLMIWGMENILKGAGVQEYYFNVHVADERWNQVVQGWRAERTSKEPEYRYRMELR